MRLIDADALEPSAVYINYGCTRIVYMDDIDEMPTIEAEPVRHGRWKIIYNNDIPYMYRCSLCGIVRIDDGKYCPNCGARMDGVEK